MKYLFLLSLLLVGCAHPEHHWVSNVEITASGYPVFHRDMVIEPYTLPRMRQCEHVRAPLMYQEWVPPVYADVESIIMYDGLVYRGSVMGYNRETKGCVVLMDDKLWSLPEAQIRTFRNDGQKREIQPGHWQEVFMGWYCSRCGSRL